ncbi:MAG: hypothetical protein P8080_08400 [Gammaproteobacteria bacterium]
MSPATAEHVLADPDLHHEHIEMESEADPVDPARLEPTRTDARLVHDVGDGQQMLEIFDGSYLRVVTSCPRSAPREFRFDLSFLDPEPKIRSSRGWLRLAVLFAAAAALAAALMLSGGSATVRAAPWLGLAAVAGLAGCMGAALLHRRSRRIVFLTRHGRAPLLALQPVGEGSHGIGEFVARLSSSARDAAATQLYPRAHRLRNEMHAHRRLHEQGALSPDAFEAAKKRILAAHG